MRLLRSPDNFKNSLSHIYTLPHKKWRGMLDPPNRLSIRPSALCFRTLKSSFWPIFFKLCMAIDIREEWFRTTNGLNLYINNRVMTLDWCKNVFFPQYLQNKWMNFYKILCMHWYIQEPCCIKCTLLLVNFYQTYSPWSTSKFCLCSISCELICEFRSNFVYSLILTRCRFGWLNNIFRLFSTELWSLIDVEISFLLNILWTNWWILKKKLYWYGQNVGKNNTNYILLFFNWVMALDWCQNFVSI